MLGLAFASLLVITLFGVILDTIGLDPSWWLSAPSLAGCYSGLHWLHDRFLWRIRLLRMVTRLPDLNGEWVGEVKSSYNQHGPAYEVSVVISQRWSKMLVRLETGQSRSHSVVASLKTADLPYPELSYLYVNSPKSNAPDTMEMHRGTATLELKGSNLEGEYYTGRGRRQIGMIKLRKA